MNSCRWDLGKENIWWRSPPRWWPRWRPVVNGRGIFTQPRTQTNPRSRMTSSPSSLPVTINMPQKLTQLRLASLATKIPEVSLNVWLQSRSVQTLILSSFPHSRRPEVLWGCVIISGPHPVRAPETWTTPRIFIVTPVEIWLVLVLSSSAFIEAHIENIDQEIEVWGDDGWLSSKTPHYSMLMLFILVVWKHKMKINEFSIAALPTFSN